MAIRVLSPASTVRIKPVGYATELRVPKQPNSKFKIIQGDFYDRDVRLNSRRFLLLMACIVSINILAVAGLNILMTQDAFELQRLKHERNIAMDQSDAISAQVNLMSSPDQLAGAAKKLGMVPAVEIKYIDLAATTVNK